VPTAEEWRDWGKEGILRLLAAEGAATQAGMEAKLSDSRFEGMTHKIDPHHLTTARNRLLADGDIERRHDSTRGKQVVTTYLLASPNKVAIRQSGRKRLLHARFMSWNKPDTKWGVAPIPAALERVVHASLLDAAPHGYMLLRPEGGEVARIAGAPVPGGRIDNAAFYTGLTAGGMPTPTILLTIEAKNLRQWIYPQTQELYQVLDKSARLRLQHPELRVFPVLVCRKAHYLTNKMAQHIGFHVIATQRQYVRPAVAGNPDDARKFEEVNTELAYNLALHEEAVEPMIGHFTKTIPGRSSEAVERWSNFVAHPDVPQLISRLRDDGISNRKRRECVQELVQAAEDVFDEDAEWHQAPEK
jgi:hypothetical protein